MPMRPSRSWASSRVLVILVGVAIALVALTVVIWRQGANESIVGVVTVLESHRICVEPTGSPRVCALVDAPSMTEGVHLGDCVRLRRSAQDLLVAVAAQSSASCD